MLQTTSHMKTIKGNRNLQKYPSFSCFSAIWGWRGGLVPAHFIFHSYAVSKYHSKIDLTHLHKIAYKNTHLPLPTRLPHFPRLNSSCIWFAWINDTCPSKHVSHLIIMTLLLLLSILVVLLQIKSAWTLAKLCD